MRIFGGVIREHAILANLGLLSAQVVSKAKGPQEEVGYRNLGGLTEKNNLLKQALYSLVKPYKVLWARPFRKAL